MSEEWRVQSFAVQQYAFDVFVAFGVVLHHGAECLFTGAVSYTQLDVYKRQVECTVLIQITAFYFYFTQYLIPGIFSFLGELFSVISVSYTHLSKVPVLLISYLRVLPLLM